MSVYSLNNVAVFLVDVDGEFIPVSASQNASLDTEEFDSDKWGIFQDPGGSVVRLEGGLELWDIPGDDNRIGPTSFKIWRYLGGNPGSIAGTYVVVGLSYSSAQQPGIEIEVDDSIGGDGYIAVMADYATLDASRRVFWGFSGVNPIEPPAPDAAFWTKFIGTREIP